MRTCAAHQARAYDHLAPAAASTTPNICAGQQWPGLEARLQVSIRILTADGEFARTPNGRYPRLSPRSGLEADSIIGALAQIATTSALAVCPPVTLGRGGGAIRLGGLVPGAKPFSASSKSQHGPRTCRSC